MSKSKIEQKKISITERKQIVNTLINSYELLEEKLNLVNKKIENSKLELKGGLAAREKRESEN